MRLFLWRDLQVALVNQVHHDLDFVELVHVDFVFLLLARQNESELSFCSCFVRRFGIAHASMALRSLNHNLDFVELVHARHSSCKHGSALT